MRHPGQAHRYGDAVSGCRIARVRFKDGRAPIEVFESKAAKSAREIRKSIVRSSSMMADPNYFGTEVAGYITIAWDAGGRWAIGTCRSVASPINRNMLPEFVRACVHETITEELVRETR